MWSSVPPRFQQGLLYEHQCTIILHDLGWSDVPHPDVDAVGPGGGHAGPGVDGEPGDQVALAQVQGEPRVGPRPKVCGAEHSQCAT